MPSQLFTNNATTKLAAAILAADTSITLTTGEGALFAAPTGGDYQLATINDGTNIEIVSITARVGDVLTVTRAQESTSANDFSLGVPLFSGVTAETLTNLAGDVSEVVIGSGATTTNSDTVTVGINTSTLAYGAVAIGAEAFAQGELTVCIGYAAYCEFASGIAIGNGVVAGGEHSIAMGTYSNSGIRSVALGGSSSAADYSISIGESNNASTRAVSLGNEANASGIDSVSIGNTSNSAGDNSIAIGKDVFTPENSMVAIGYDQDKLLNQTTAWAATTSVLVGDIVKLAASTFMECTTAGNTGGTIPATPAAGSYVLDGSAVWRGIAINDNGIQLGWGSQSISSRAVSIGTGVRSAGTAVGSNCNSGFQATCIGKNSSAHSSKSISIGTGSSSYNIQRSLMVGAMPAMHHAYDWWGSDAIEEYTGLMGMFSSEPMDLTGGETWTASTSMNHGDVIQPTTPNGNMYVRGDYNFNIWGDPELLAYTPGSTGASEPTWGTLFEDYANDGNGDWLCLPYNDGTTTYKVNTDPSVKMVVEEVIFICSKGTAITGQASISLGETGNLTKLGTGLTTAITADNMTTKWIITNPVMVSDITVRIDTLAVGTKMYGKFIFKGFYYKDDLM